MNKPAQFDTTDKSSKMPESPLRCGTHGRSVIDRRSNRMDQWIKQVTDIRTKQEYNQRRQAQQLSHTRDNLFAVEIYSKKPVKGAMPLTKHKLVLISLRRPLSP